MPIGFLFGIPPIIAVVALIGGISSAAILIGRSKKKDLPLQVEPSPVFALGGLALMVSCLVGYVIMKPAATTVAPPETAAVATTNEETNEETNKQIIQLLRELRAGMASKREPAATEKK